MISSVVFPDGGDDCMLEDTPATLRITTQQRVYNDDEYIELDDGPPQSSSSDGQAGLVVDAGHDMYTLVAGQVNRSSVSFCIFFFSIHLSVVCCTQ